MKKKAKQTEEEDRERICRNGARKKSKEENGTIERKKERERENGRRRRKRKTKFVRKARRRKL